MKMRQNSAVTIKLLAVAVLLAAAFDIQIVQNGLLAGDRPLPAWIHIGLLVNAALGVAAAVMLWRRQPNAPFVLRLWMALALLMLDTLAIAAPTGTQAGGVSYYLFLFAITLTAFVFADYIVRRVGQYEST